MDFGLSRFYFAVACLKWCNAARNFAALRHAIWKQTAGHGQDQRTRLALIWRLA
jgi:hypothetical protein